MPSTMYDAVEIANYPADTEVAAGYVNGHWPTADGLPARFPNATLVTIDVNGSRPDARVLDMEWGDATPAMCPPWAEAHGADPIPVIYASASRVKEVTAAFATAGYDGEYRLWTAHYTGHAHFCGQACGLSAAEAALVVATQWADPGQYDISLVATGWPAPAVAEPIQQQENATDAAAVNTNLGQALEWLDEMEGIVSEANITVVGPPNTQALVEYMARLSGDAVSLAEAIRTALHAARKAAGGE